RSRELDSQQVLVPVDAEARRVEELGRRLDRVPEARGDDRRRRLPVEDLARDVGPRESADLLGARLLAEELGHALVRPGLEALRRREEDLLARDEVAEGAGDLAEARRGDGDDDERGSLGRFLEVGRRAE